MNFTAEQLRELLEELYDEGFDSGQDSAHNAAHLDGMDVEARDSLIDAIMERFD
jgi:hypothetical protein